MGDNHPINDDELYIYKALMSVSLPKLSSRGKEVIRILSGKRPARGPNWPE